MHPDKNTHEKAADAFNLINQAFKMLQDIDKKRLYQRIMREARERVEIDRKKVNKSREDQGIFI